MAVHQNMPRLSSRGMRCCDRLVHTTRTGQAREKKAVRLLAWHAAPAWTSARNTLDVADFLTPISATRGLWRGDDGIVLFTGCPL